MRHPETVVQTPAAARRRLGDELRTAREIAGLTLGDAAQRIQRSAATLSRLENGKSTPRVVDVKALLDHYAERDTSSVPNGTRDRVVGLAEAGREQEWFLPFKDVISSDMTAEDHQRYVEFETDATAIKAFQPELVPGLLQTRAYAESVTEVFFPTRTPAERSRFVDFRMARQHVLTRKTGAVDLSVVIGEAALRRVIGSPAGMREQLTALLAHISDGLQNVTVRIAPVGLGIPAVVGGPFLTMEFGTIDEAGLVYLESRSGSQYNQTPAVFDRYQRLYADLSAVVPDASESRAMVEKVLTELG